MRIGAVFGILVGVASIGFGISNIWRHWDGVNEQGRRIIIGVPILLGLAIGSGSLFIAWAPQGRQVLAGVPGRDVQYDGGRLLDTSIVGGVAGAPSYVARFYGANEADDAIVTKLASSLGALGFIRVPERPGPVFRPGDGRQLAAFANGRIMVRLQALEVPRRIGGVLVTGYRQIVVVVVSDDGEPVS
jgi:hypothetical protein